MRSCRVRVGHQAEDRCFCKKRGHKEIDIETRWEYKDLCRSWSYNTTSQGTFVTTKTSGSKALPLLEPSERVWPGRSFELGLLTSRTAKEEFHNLSPTKHVAACYSSPRN